MREEDRQVCSSARQSIQIPRQHQDSQSDAENYSLWLWDHCLCLQRGREQSTIVVQERTRLTDVFPIFWHEWNNRLPPIGNTPLQSGEYSEDGWSFLGFLSILLNPCCHQQVPQCFGEPQGWLGWPISFHNFEHNCLVSRDTVERNASCDNLFNSEICVSSRQRRELTSRIVIPIA